MATAAENGHSHILRYFFTEIPQCRQSPHGPWSPVGDADENAVPKEWRRPLLPGHVVLCSITRSQPAVFQTLMDFGMSVHYIMDKTGSPLTVAILRKDVKMVRFLLSKGANANDTYWLPPETVLARAAKLPSLEIMKLLLEHGAKIEGSRALVGAAEGGNIDAATVLLAHGADINEVFRWDLWDDDLAMDTIGTALYIAVKHDQADFVQFLLERGARTDLANGEGITPRQLAQSEGKSEMLKLLDGMKK